MPTQIITAIKAAAELGIAPTLYYALYTLGLKSGFYRGRTPISPKSIAAPWELSLQTDFLPLPEKPIIESYYKENKRLLLDQADEVVNGHARLFGGDPVPIELGFQRKLRHWSFYGTPHHPENEALDIKWVWEPGRFGWAITLGRAYYFSSDPKYATAFWQMCEVFFNNNPTNAGPHWYSGQEVAIRLVSLLFSYNLVKDSPVTTHERGLWLSRLVADHAERIPPTVIYARAQNNNHLLTEAMGLFTAGIVLPRHPNSIRWIKMGWDLLNHGFQSQVSPNGSYVQHSTNYQRLILQVALWASFLAKNMGMSFANQTLERLVQATHWLLALTDMETGRVPNLGPNDSAYILPVSVCDFDDFRPVLQAASRTFLHCSVFPPGPWDEMAFWLTHPDEPLDPTPRTPSQPRLSPFTRRPYTLKHPDNQSWAYLRAVRFTSRPGHADQLHLDLWWRGINLAGDPGSYSYNAEPPWDNSLSRTMVHNTVSLDDRDQMNRAGRFLWLDWAQAEIWIMQEEKSKLNPTLVAMHVGYKKYGVVHQRRLSAIHPHGWSVEDRLTPVSMYATSMPYWIRLHWLLPDWDWEFLGNNLQLNSPHGVVTLRTSLFSNKETLTTDAEFSLIKSGELLHGSIEALPILGWRSLHYGSKQPALSFVISIHHTVPVVIKSKWIFPD